MFLDSLGEVANMITGNATDQGNDSVLNITTPAIAAGDNLSVHLVPNQDLWSIPSKEPWRKRLRRS